MSSAGSELIIDDISRFSKVMGAVKASIPSILLDRLISVDLKQENRMRSQNNLNKECAGQVGLYCNGAVCS